jgi:hypothetical protein
MRNMRNLLLSMDEYLKDIGVDSQFPMKISETIHKIS